MEKLLTGIVDSIAKIDEEKNELKSQLEDLKKSLDDKPTFDDSSLIDSQKKLSDSIDDINKQISNINFNARALLDDKFNAIDFKGIYKDDFKELSDYVKSIPIPQNGKDAKVNYDLLKKHINKTIDAIEILPQEVDYQKIFNHINEQIAKIPPAEKGLQGKEGKKGEKGDDGVGIKTIKSDGRDIVVILTNGDKIKVERPIVPVVMKGGGGTSGEAVTNEELEKKLENYSLITGYDDIPNINLSFDDSTRTLTVSATTGTFEFHTQDGTRYTNRVSDSIVWNDTEGLIYIYYDNDGNLQQEINPDRKRQVEIMNASLPVSYILWDATNKESIFVTDILKGREMALTTWVKNFYDVDIYSIQGLNTISDPSGGSGSVDTDAQVGFTEGELLFTDRTFGTNTRNVGDDWLVLYLDNDNVRKQLKSSYMFLQDNDLGGGSTALLYNNGAVPQPVASGNYVWYFVGINNNIIKEERLVSFMGQTEYSTENVALDELNNEISVVENSFSIRQEFALTHAVLFEYKTSFGNTTKTRIVDIQAIESATGTSSALNVPDSLINGGFTNLHHHIRPRVITPVDYQVTTADGDIFASNGATITLPTVTGEIQRYSVTNTDGTLITIDGLDANLLGQTSQQLTQKYDSVTFFTDETEWYAE